MANEVLVKRTIWVAECKCTKDIQDVRGAKERYCVRCKKWVPYIEQSYTGPALEKS